MTTTDKTKIVVFKHDYFDSEEKPSSNWQLERPERKEFKHKLIGALGILVMKRDLIHHSHSLHNSKSVPEHNYNKSKWRA